MEKILKIVYDKSKNNDFLSIKDIEKIIDYLLEKNILNRYVKDLKVFKDESTSVMSYSRVTKTLCIFRKNLLKQISAYESQARNAISDNEIYYFINFNLLHIILHEIEHVKNEKKIILNNDLESKIINTEIQCLINDRNIEGYEKDKKKFNEMEKAMEIYNKYYIYSPQERIAEINSYTEVHKLTEQGKYFIPHTNKIMELLIYRSLLKGYEKDRMYCPTMYYLEKICKKDEYKDLPIYNKDKNKMEKRVLMQYPFYKRIKLGLYITEKERKDTASRIYKR